MCIVNNVHIAYSAHKVYIAYIAYIQCTSHTFHILRASFHAPNNSRTALMPLNFDGSTANYISHLSRAAQSMEVHTKANKTHTHTYTLFFYKTCSKLLEMWVRRYFGHPRPILQMPELENKPSLKCLAWGDGGMDLIT